MVCENYNLIAIKIHKLRKNIQTTYQTADRHEKTLKHIW